MKLVTTLALAAMLATFAVPPAAADHSLCHNGTPDDRQIAVILGNDVSVDLGTDNNARVVCVNSTGVVVYALGAPVGTGAVVMVKLCQGNVPGDQCATVLGKTGAGVGPGVGLTCTLGTCVYVWANGVQLAP